MKSAAAELQVPDPPGKKLGWAIVGLGSLAINQILPAFAKCEKSKVVALVSGHPDKANKLALRYGVNPKNIYNYQNYDTIRDNPEVDIIYIVLPNGMHAEYTVRGHQAGKHVLSEKPMANTPADCQQMIDAGTQGQSKADGGVPLPLRTLQPGSDPHGAPAGTGANQGHSRRSRLQHRRSHAMAAEQERWREADR